MTGAARKRHKPIRLKEVPLFNGRGMKRVHGWYLKRWISEFSKHHIYRGDIFATKDNRLLVRFRFHTRGFCYGGPQAYEIRGMTAADVLNLEFDPCSEEAAALKGFVVKIQTYADRGALLTQAPWTVDVKSPLEANLWVSWVPQCVRRAWDNWIELIEDD